MLLLYIFFLLFSIDLLITPVEHKSYFFTFHVYVIRL